MTATTDQGAAERGLPRELPKQSPKPSSKHWIARFARPGLGLVLPVGLALFWEIAVHLGLSNGRLVPPPSVIFATFADLARTGELQEHAAATLWRVGWGFVFGVAGGTIVGAIAGYSALTYRLVDPTLQGLRAVPSIAWVPLFILWFGIFEASKIILIAVGVFLSGLSRRHGGGPFGRSENRRGRTRLPPVGLCDDPPYPAARGAAGLRAFVARRPRARLDVRAGR